MLTVIALIVLAILSDKFFTAENLLNQGRLMSEVGLVALAMTFVIVTGGIDLSVGSILGLTAILLGVFWKNVGLPLPAAMFAALACGTFAGLATASSSPASSVPPADRHPGDAGALPRPRRRHQRGALGARLSGMVLLLRPGRSPGRAVPACGCWDSPPSIAAVILGMTPFGRATYAIGANETAARFSGIRVHATKLWIYTAAGFLSALAAVIFVSRVTTTRSDMGTGLELDVITGVVLGGTSIFGGRGTIIGTVLGLMLIQALKNGLALSGVKGDGTIVVIGVVLDRGDPGRCHLRQEQRRLNFGRTSVHADPPVARGHNGSTNMKKLTLTVALWPWPDERRSTRRTPPGPAATTCRPARWPATAHPPPRPPCPMTAAQPTSAPDRKGKKITVVDIPKLIGIGYFNATTKGILDAAAELGNVDAKTDGPTKANIDEQITFIDNYITSGVDGILFAANDPVAIAPVLKKALVKGHQRRRL